MQRHSLGMGLSLKWRRSFLVTATANADPAWGAGFIDLLGWHYRYGDVSVLARHYDTAEAYMSYLSQYVTKDTNWLLQTKLPRHTLWRLVRTIRKSQWLCLVPVTQAT